IGGVARAAGTVIGGAARAAGNAIGARPWAFVAVTALMVALDAVLPPLVLSVARKPWTYFAFNPWLKRLPEYLVSDRPIGEKVDFLSRVALFWFSADGAYGAPEWGFAVDSLDLIRMVATGALAGAYFCLLLALRRQGSPLPAEMAARRAGGALGVLAAIVGLSTGPCGVVGCGAPVLPVVALAFAGLSSGTLALLSGFSRAMAVMVTAGLALGVLCLARRLAR